MPLPDWVKTEDWDALRLGGKRVPGIAKVKAKLGCGLDIKKPKGGKKGTIKDDGDPLAELEVELDMSHQDVVEFAALVPIIRPVAKGGARDPLQIEHPEAALWGIFNVTVGDIDSDHPESGGRKKITLKLIEWAAAPVTVKSSAKQPDDAADRGAWGALVGDSVDRFINSIRPAPAEPPTKKPSASAGKNI